MKTLGIIYKGVFLGTILTCLPDGQAENLFKEYLLFLDDPDDVDIDDFIDWLVDNEHDKNADRFIYDGMILV